MHMKVMPSSRKESPTSEWEDENLFSEPSIYQADTSDVTWYENKLLHLLVEKNFANFNDLVQHEIVDMNYFYGAPHNGTLLDIACRTKGMSEFVKIILQKNVNMNAINKITGKAAIHEAIENSAIDVVEVLIGYRCSIDIEDRNGNTPLHTSIKRNNLQITKLLLENSRGRFDINMANRLNQTPLHIALLEGCTEAAILLLKFPYVDLDFQTDSQGHTCRQIIQQRYPKLGKMLLTDPKIYVGNPAKSLYSLLERGETEIFIKLASKMSTEFLNLHGDGRNDGTFLEHACYYGYADVVDMLLRKGVDPNKTTVGASFKKNAPIANVRGTSPIQIAAENGYYEVFAKLLNHPEIELHTSEAGSPLHSVINGMFHPFHRKHREGRQHRQCLELILNEVVPQARLDIDYVDEEGNTALHDAVLFNDKCVIKSLLYAGAHPYLKNFKGEVPLTSIKADILEDYLDDCISTRDDHIYAKYFNITFDYTIFVNPSKSHQPEGHETEFFTIIQRVPELRKLLKHPLSASFLHVKWYLVRKYYYINFIFYLIFCLMLNWYIFRIHESPRSSNSPTFSSSSSKNDILDGPSVIIVFYGILVLRELSQFCVSPKSYIKSPENWLEMLVISSTGTFLALENESNADDLSPISACVIIGSWMALIFLLGSHPTFSNYVEMFKTVAFNIFKYLSVFLILSVSFAFSFHILSKNQTNNQNSFKNEVNRTNESTSESLFFKSIIMLIGEFSTENTLPLGLAFTCTHLLFILFIFLMTIVLYSLLNGLAVSDVQAIRADAELVAQISRVKLISQLERLALFNPCRYFHRLVPGRFLYFRVWILIIGEQCAAFYNKLFLEKVTMYPKIKIHVLSHAENSINFDSEPLFNKNKFLSKMPSYIVKQAMEILENRNEYEDTVDSLNVHSVKKHPPRFQSIDKLGRYFNAQIRDLEIKMDEKMAKRDEKLLQNLSNLMSDFERKNEKFKTQIYKFESRIDDRIENMMESISNEFMNQNKYLEHHYQQFK